MNHSAVHALHDDIALHEGPNPRPPLVVFGAARWNFDWQRAQQLLTRIAMHYRVFYVETPHTTHADPWLEANEVAPGVEVLVAHTRCDAPGFHDEQFPVMQRLLAAFLRTLAAHITARWGQVDTVARIAEDMLGWLVSDTQTDQQLVLDVQAALGMTPQASSPALSSVHALTASIAIWSAESSSIEAAELLRLAMNEAARIDPLNEERVVLADPTLRTRTRTALAIHQQLEEGLERGELMLYFQPIFAVHGDPRPVGAEALLRWNHPERGVLAPGQFLDAIEHTPLMSRIDAWVMEQAIHSLLTWNGNLPPYFRLHVNITARSLASGRVMEILGGDLPASLRKHLAVELTERLYVSDMPSCVSALQSLRALGVHVALDDFGTGFSSLSHVSLLPCDTMKIDRSFVTGIGINPQMRRLLESMVSMAHSLGLTVIVEGVEHDDELAVLRELGCPFVQGYLLGQPRPEAEFLRHMR